MDADIVRYLGKLPLFQGLPDGAIKDMAQEVTVHKLKKDDVLAQKGDEGDSIYMIRTGWVKIVTEDSDGDELVLNHCGPSEVVGEMSLIDGEPRSASVIALTPLSALELKRDSFMTVMQRQPLLALDVMRNLSARVRYATAYIEKAIELSHRIAAGDYSFAMDEIQSVQSTIVDTHKANEAKARELLSAFFEMVEGVRTREENLKQQLRELSIEIDETQRRREFENLTESTFFTNLKTQARQMRAQQHKGDVPEED